MFDGLVCENTSYVRRIAIHGASPRSLDGKILYVLPYDDSIVGGMDEGALKAYMEEESNYTILEWNKLANP